MCAARPTIRHTGLPVERTGRPGFGKMMVKSKQAALYERLSQSFCGELPARPQPLHERHYDPGPGVHQ